MVSASSPTPARRSASTRLDTGGESGRLAESSLAFAKPVSGMATQDLAISPRAPEPQHLESVRPTDAAAPALSAVPTSVPLGLEAPAGNPRFPLLDPLRGCAAAAVFLYHFSFATHTSGLFGNLIQHGNCGVALFFLISGFLLYRPFVAARARKGPQIRAGSFYRRRALRIIPAYWVAITILALYPGLPGFRAHWWLLYVFGQIYDPNLTFSGISAAWSLCIEVTFYLLLPLYAFGIERITRSASHRSALRRELGILAGLALLSVLVHEGIQAATTGVNQNLSLTLPGTFYLFALGMAVAVLGVHWEETRIPSFISRYGAVIWITALLTYVAIAVGIDYRSLGSVNPVYAVVGLLILLPATVTSSSRVERLVLRKGIVWLGVVSYAFYLWHQCVLEEIDKAVASPALLFIAAATVSVVIASISYKVVEAPWLRSKALLARQRWR